MFISGLSLVLAAAVFLALQFRPATSEESIDWELELVGRSGQEIVLSYDEVKAIPGGNARGGYFSTVGAIFGPYDVKGVPLETLFEMMGGFTPSDILFVSAADGYSAVYDYEQLNGTIDTFTIDTLKQIPHGELDFLLIYEQDGEPLSHEDGRPLRLAITGDGDFLTEGHWWVKWVNRIEIRPLPSTEDVES